MKIVVIGASYGGLYALMELLGALPTDFSAPVVVVQHTFTQPEMPFFKRGTPGWELHPEVASRPRDHWIEKNLPGSFTGTDLEEWLRERGLDTVTVAGYMTHMCCDTTARQAAHLGLKVEFLSDATGTRHRVVLPRLGRVA